MHNKSTLTYFKNIFSSLLNQRHVTFKACNISAIRVYIWLRAHMQIRC